MLPEPTTGLVIRYAYLWFDELMAGREEGVKVRPCVIVRVLAATGQPTRVMVVPVMHSSPRNSGDALELPMRTKERLGLDSASAWIVITEVNSFIWPGPDLQPITLGNSRSYACGSLPHSLTTKLLTTLAENIKSSRLRTANR